MCCMFEMLIRRPRRFADTPLPLQYKTGACSRRTHEPPTSLATPAVQDALKVKLRCGIALASTLEIYDTGLDDPLFSKERNGTRRQGQNLTARTSAQKSLPRCSRVQTL